MSKNSHLSPAILHFPALNSGVSKEAPLTFESRHFQSCLNGKSNQISIFPLTGMKDHPPIPVADLQERIDELKADHNNKFSQEYEVYIKLFDD